MHGLLLPEEIKGISQVSGAGLNFGPMSLVAGKCVPCVELRFCGIANQRIASTDIEVDVGQGFQLPPGVDLRHQLKEEAQLTDFDRFGHDVHAE